MLSANKNSRVPKIPKDGMTDLIRSIAAEKHEAGQPFYVLDLATIERLMDKWNCSFPNVTPFYAVKCNTEPALLTELANLGANFDCASLLEIDTVLSLGISPNRIIFANPCKAISHIKHAAAVGVNLTTFDSKFEVDKIKKWHPQCHLLLRIKAPRDSGSLHPFGKKFGVLPEEIEPLLHYACNVAGLKVVGVSFHVGSVAQDPNIYREAIAGARVVFDVADYLGIPKMQILDIGGGFRSTPLFEEIAGVVNESVQDYFSEPNLTIIAEPGRFFPETAFVLVTHVIGKRVRGEKIEYWIDEGIYGSFRPRLYNSCFVGINPISVKASDEECSQICESTIYGPSCDSLDAVAVDIKLLELQLDDLIVFYNMGAYSKCGGTKFNGFDMLSIPTYLVSTNSS
ncbi:Mitochondrial 2-oxoadipate and 2-oxoglutarate transporter [Datura stramonium]|uniref:Mitochondrial 2-oxoadipate and 2-oxoglutarate transporter n=1 Tax=Datura stramonium TaxID=4076 RepID=A0ABS8SBT5_DATST|nr:Mitochondrial 2-oxoadipate and 2-oxoglutarate transporter [Datura stramonium]